MSQKQRGKRLFPGPARRPCPTPLLRMQIGRGDYPAQTEKLAFSKTVFPSRHRSPEPGFFSLFIRFYLHLCSFFCLFVSTGIGKKGERKSLRFLHRQPKGRKKKKITKHTKRGFEEEPSPEASPLEGHVPHPTKFKVHPNLLHPKTFFK